MEMNNNIETRGVRTSGDFFNVHSCLLCRQRTDKLLMVGCLNICRNCADSFDAASVNQNTLEYKCIKCREIHKRPLNGFEVFNNPLTFSKNNFNTFQYCKFCIDIYHKTFKWLDHVFSHTCTNTYMMYMYVKNQCLLLMRLLLLLIKYLSNFKS